MNFRAGNFIQYAKLVGSLKVGSLSRVWMFTVGLEVIWSDRGTL